MTETLMPLAKKLRVYAAAGGGVRITLTSESAVALAGMIEGRTRILEIIADERQEAAELYARARATALMQGGALAAVVLAIDWWLT